MNDNIPRLTENLAAANRIGIAAAERAMNKPIPGHNVPAPPRTSPLIDELGGLTPRARELLAKHDTPALRAIAGAVNLAEEAVPRLVSDPRAAVDILRRAISLLNHAARLTEPVPLCKGYVEGER